MNKKELLDILSAYPDNAEVVIEVHDTTLNEDLYDFTIDPISWTRIDGNQMINMHELRLCPTKYDEA